MPVLNLSLDMVRVWDLTKANRLEKGPQDRPIYNSGAGLVCGHCRLVLTGHNLRVSPAVPPLPMSYRGSSF